MSKDVLGAINPFKTPDIDVPPARTVPSRSKDKKAAEAEREARKRAKRARGKAQTILTDADLEAETPNVQRKTLLGGGTTS